jgi:hypothetical protein
MKKKRLALKAVAGMKVTKYLLRHPVRGTRNLLALRGLRSLVMTKRAAVVAVAAATTAVAVPLAVRASRNSER